MCKNIVLLGSGNIGIRHLEGLNKLKFKVKITVIDKSSLSLKKAKFFFNNLPKNNKINKVSFVNSMDSLDKKTDLAIIATNAHNRYIYIKNLINKTKIKNLVIEKVAFQSNREFKMAIRIIKKNKIKAWINCSSRLQNLYINIQKKLRREKKIDMLLSCNNCNIASNAIHILDRLYFFSKSSIASIDLSGLKKRIYKSKRKNYLEFKGCFRAYTKRGDKLTIIDDNDNSNEHFININSGNYKISIFPDLNLAFCSTKLNKWKTKKLNYDVPYQSKLTSIFAKEIIEKGKCGLTDIDESYLLHKKMLNSFLKFINNINKKKNNLCMIT